MWCLDAFMRRATKKRSPPGSWNWRGSIKSLMCVLLLEWRKPLTFRFQKELVTNGSVTVSTVRHDIVNTDAIVSDIRRNMLGSQEGAVSETLNISAIERMFTVTQTQTRLANSTVNGSNVLYLHLASLVNHLPQHRRPVLDVTN